MPSECECSSSSDAQASVTCKATLFGDGVDLWGPIKIPSIPISTTLEFNLCSTPASMSASQTITFPDVPDDLNSFIEDGVKAADSDLSWENPKLTLKKSVEAGKSESVDIPIFYAEIFQLTAKLELALSGSIDAFKINVDLNLCAGLAGPVAKLMPAATTQLCANDLPDCTGCSATGTCPWVAKHFPCDDDTSCTPQSDGSCTEAAWTKCKNGPGPFSLTDEGKLRVAVDTLCFIPLGQINIPKLLGNPPYPLFKETYDFSDACPAPSGPSPPPVTNTVKVTVAADTDEVQPFVSPLTKALASATKVSESNVQVTLAAASTVISMGVTSPKSQASTVASSMNQLFATKTTAQTWLKQNGAGDLNVTAVSKVSQTEAPGGGGGGLATGALIGIIIGALAGVAILAAVIMMATKKSSASPMISRNPEGAKQMADSGSNQP